MIYQLLMSEISIVKNWHLRH